MLSICVSFSLCYNRYLHDFLLGAVWTRLNHIDISDESDPYGLVFSSTSAGFNSWKK